MSVSQEIGSRKYLGWLLWLLILLSLTGVAGNIWLSIAGCGRIFGEAPGVFFGGVGFLILGVLVVRNRPENRIGWLAIIIRRTLQYGLLTGLLALIYFGGVVLTQSIFSSLTGNTNSPLITVISALAIVVLFTPLRTRVQNFIDRRFYRAKYDAERTLAQFAATARDEVDVERLAGALLSVVEETMQPERISLWLTSEKTKERG